jgi:hypothetical protein
MKVAMTALPLPSPEVFFENVTFHEAPADVERSRNSILPPLQA